MPFQIFKKNTIPSINIIDKTEKKVVRNMICNFLFEKNGSHVGFGSHFEFFGLPTNFWFLFKLYSKKFSIQVGWKIKWWSNKSADGIDGREKELRY
jgi:hypothetical protein